MSDLPGEMIGPEVARPSVEGPRRKRWQVGLRTLSLLMAVIAVWLTVVINRRESTKLETRIRAIQPLAHALIVNDTGKAAVVKLDELWMDDNRWDLYLPPGEYRICVASREVDAKGTPPPKKTAILKGGRHRLGLEFGRRGEGWHFRVTSDDAELMTFDETKDWGESGSSTGAGSFPMSTQIPADEPIELYRRRYMLKLGPNKTAEPKGPADGLILWIEPVKDAMSSSP